MRSPSSGSSFTRAREAASRVIAQVLRTRPHVVSRLSPPDLLDRLLADESDALRIKYASAVRDYFLGTDDQGKREFFDLLAKGYNTDNELLEEAIDRYQQRRDPLSLSALHTASEPGRQEILRRLNTAPGGTAFIVEMRAHALRLKQDIGNFAALDRDFLHLLGSWFNPGFLQLRRLDFEASANLASMLMQYEAVHAIDSWQSLRSRLEPSDRRCYALFHPQLGDEPLIFVELAFTRGIPNSIVDILRTDRDVICAEAADTAVFYSISNCQEGLRGIPFGGLLIKQVIDRLRNELPSLRVCVTLSPIPGLVRWLKQRAELEGKEFGPVPADSFQTFDKAAAARLIARTAYYLASTSPSQGDPVARFHLGNGASVDRINWMADLSAKGLAQSCGIMVNYRYVLDRVEQNRKAFAAGQGPVLSPAVRKLAKAGAPLGARGDIAARPQAGQQEWMQVS